jgi:serine/threonine-protein kinase
VIVDESGVDAPASDIPPPPPPPPSASAPPPPRAAQADPTAPEAGESTVAPTATADPTTPMPATALAAGTEAETHPGRVATATMPVVDLGITEATPSEIYDDERPRRRVGRILLILVLVLAGVAALTYAGWLLLRTKSHEVPQLIGISESVALAEVEGNEWVILTERERDDDFPEPDTIIRTIPVAGEILDEGESFTLVISDGPEFRTLPEFVDLRVEEAQAILAELGLIGVEAPERVFSETVPDGSVISWAVEGSGGLVAGAKILPGETVVLTVSKGPAPRPVPVLAGLNVEQAAAAVGDLQLELAQEEEVFSDDVAVGLVVTQAPAPDVLVARGSTITIKISKGPDVVAFPAIVDRPYAEAEKLLIDTGFTIGSVLGTTEGTVISASIHGSSANEGDIHRRGTPVDIVSL